MIDEQARHTQPIVDPDQWVDRHGDYLFRYCVSRLGDRDAAEELVQETFLAALRTVSNFAGRSSERTWFVAILKNKIVDHLRKSSRRREDASNPTSDQDWDLLFDRTGHFRVKPAAWGNQPEAALESAEFWETFHSCLSKLPHRLAAAFSLREVDEIGSAELCEVLNVTPGNLGVLLYRARLGLRRCLEIHWFHSKHNEVS